MDLNREVNSMQIMVSYASISRRLVALLLDFMILLIPCWIAGQIIPFVGGIAVLFFYGPILESSEIRATLGKHLMGIQVCDSMGRRITFRAALIRNLLKFVSSMLLFIGFIIALFTQKKQTLHDLLADTYVVYGRSERPVVDAWSQSVKELARSASAATGSSHTLSELERLQALREKGALTEEEFLEQKKKFLYS